MPYGNFSFDSLEEKFAVRFQEVEKPEDSFVPETLPEIEADAYFVETMSENLSVASRVNTEKIRSELLIAPLLMYVRKLMNREISVFSGVSFNVDVGADLVGIPDFLISFSHAHYKITAPVAAVVEAKKENIPGGVPQCVAELIALHRFNVPKKTSFARYYGVVSDGSEWLFLRYTPPGEIWLDYRPIELLPVERLCAIWIYLLNDVKNSNL